jgi:superfamily I DNA and RNA helicase
MKINQIVQETTTSGSVAPVEHSFVKMQTRSPSVYGNTKAGSLFKGKKTKAPYANSINEGAEISEAELQEDDIIVVPGYGRTRKTGFTKHGQSRVDHEVEMARSDVLATMKNARAIYELLKHKSEEEGLEGWVQEKLIKANDYLNAVKEYYDEKMMQQEGKIDFAKKIQKNVDKRNKAVVKTSKEVGSRVADIGAGGKEYNVKTDKAWDDAHKVKESKTK